MVAEHNNCVRREASYAPQRGEGLRATVDQIARKQQQVAVRVEADPLQQLIEFGVAALYVADGPAGHGSAPGPAISEAAPAWRDGRLRSGRQTAGRHQRASGSCRALIPLESRAPRR